MLGSNNRLHLPRQEIRGITMSVQVDVGAFVMPNEDIESNTPLTAFVVPLEALETVAGLKFFPKTLTAAKRQSVDAAARRWQQAGLLGTKVTSAMATACILVRTLLHSCCCRRNCTLSLLVCRLDPFPACQQGQRANLATQARVAFIFVLLYLSLVHECCTAFGPCMTLHSASQFAEGDRGRWDQRQKSPQQLLSGSQVHMPPSMPAATCEMHRLTIILRAGSLQARHLCDRQETACVLPRPDWYVEGKQRHSLDRQSSAGPPQSSSGISQGRA